MSTFQATAQVNPPLPFTPRAIIDRLRHHATNGAAYIQLQATKSLARILGLYDQTTPLSERLRDPQTEPEQPALAEGGRRPFTLISEEDLPEEDDDYP